MLFSAREEVLNKFKTRLFAIKNLDKIWTREPTREPTPELVTEPIKHNKSKLKLQQEFIKEVIANEKYINDEYFGIILSIKIHYF